jgi:hypothetical protein
MIGVQSLPLLFLKNPLWPKYLGPYRQGSTLGADSHIRE